MSQTRRERYLARIEREAARAKEDLEKDLIKWQQTREKLQAAEKGVRETRLRRDLAQWLERQNAS